MKREGGQNEQRPRISGVKGEREQTRTDKRLWRHTTGCREALKGVQGEVTENKMGHERQSEETEIETSDRMTIKRQNTG
jgi:sarcosine oxidase delta subunit